MYKYVIYTYSEYEVTYTSKLIKFDMSFLFLFFCLFFFGKPILHSKKLHNILMEYYSISK